MKPAVDTLSDADLTAAVMGGGDEHDAYALLESCGGIAGLTRLGPGALAERTDDLGAWRLAAAVELGRRAMLAATDLSDVTMPDRKAVEAWAKPRLAHLDHEELWILCLDGRHHLRAAERAAAGGLHGLHVSARDVLRIALREAASGIVLVHNHPSGDPTPSDEDIAFTHHAAEAAGVVGLALVDHVIVARRKSASMFDMGLLTGRLSCKR